MNTSDRRLFGDNLELSDQPVSASDPGLRMPAFGKTDSGNSRKPVPVADEDRLSNPEEVEVGYIEVSADGIITSCNATICRLLSATRDQLIGTRCEEHVDEKTAALIYQAFSQMNCSTITNKDFTYQLTESDGTIRTFEIYITSVNTPESGLSGFWGIIRDVSEQDHLTKGSENRRSQDLVFNRSKGAILTVDALLKVVETNRKIKLICGASSREIIGQPFSSYGNNCSRACYDVLYGAKESGVPVTDFQINCKLKNRPGQKVNLSIYPLQNKKEMFIGSILIMNALSGELRKGVKGGGGCVYRDIIGNNRKMREIYTLLENLANIETTVLITGESGTGKELIARALHYNKNKGMAPFVIVNCSALAENLLESELFGHVRGSFTGAIKDTDGRFQTADNGTILLDEIGDISPSIQVKLLRVLQEKEFEKVGESVTRKVDVRVIASTNSDLKKLVREGKFREDLYYRLKVVEIELPPLRERKDDIPLLVNHFIQTFNSKFRKSIKGISPSVNRLFMKYSWPGNIRELEHVIERAFILCQGERIELRQMPDDMRLMTDVKTENRRTSDSNGAEPYLEALTKTGWNKAKAARLLNINRRTLYRKLEKYNIHRPKELDS